MNTQRKETRRDRWAKDLEMCLSVSPGIYHEMDIPGFSLQSRVLFGWRKQRQLCVPCLEERRVGKTMLSQRSVIGYVLDFCGSPGGGGQGRGSCEAGSSIPAIVLLGTALWRAVHQGGEPTLADELEKSTYMQTYGTSSRNNQVDFQK